MVRTFYDRKILESIVWREFWSPSVDLATNLKFFTRTSAIPRTRHSRLITSLIYPYPTSFTENGQTDHFKYTRILEEDATRVTFQAKFSDPVDDSDDSPDIVVKFVTRYGTDVHKFLASEDHAPRLRYCGPISGIDDG